MWSSQKQTWTPSVAMQDKIMRPSMRDEGLRTDPRCLLTRSNSQPHNRTLKAEVRRRLCLLRWTTTLRLSLYVRNDWLSYAFRVHGFLSVLSGKCRVWTQIYVTTASFHSCPILFTQHSTFPHFYKMCKDSLYVRCGKMCTVDHDTVRFTDRFVT
jgi:hypothetical protein